MACINCANAAACIDINEIAPLKYNFLCLVSPTEMNQASLYSIPYIEQAFEWGGGGDIFIKYYSGKYIKDLIENLLSLSRVISRLHRFCGTSFNGFYVKK